MSGYTNTTSRLGDVSTGLEGVIDALNTVVLHTDEEAGGELRSTGASIEECWRGMSEPTS